MRTELLVDGHRWWRIADPSWADPLDPTFALERGGRWNAPGSHPTLYLNEDVVTARLNLRLFIEQMPYEPEDLREDSAPLLIGATLPRAQRVADAHSPEGLTALGLPTTYPRTGRRSGLVPHPTCQTIGSEVRTAGLRGVRARSAQVADGAGRELAWFPATVRSRAVQVARLAFATWFWG
jgi:hypothetical protein